ncbi:hypothetical protein H7142_00365 [Candidatus Saccharibacteria bacterium]|nr:hypothetical protein [Candidatus Saccharibacteria bacterium]
MSILTLERSAKHRADSNTGDILFSHPIEMARTILPGLVEKSPANAATLPEIEDTLGRLTSEAEQLIADKKRVPRRIRKELTRYAHRLLDITEAEPDLHESRSFNLIGHVADTTGERELLAIALDQATRSESSHDTNDSLRAIELAIELDKPYAEVMRTLSSELLPAVTERYEETHVPLAREYDFLFDKSAAGSITKHSTGEHYPMYSHKD